jgi:putative phosphoesterase
MEIAIISDTHVPSRVDGLPAWVREQVRTADHVLHAGDFDSKGAFADVRELAPELTAVAGNMDPNLGLPAVATVARGGVEFVVTHGTGSTRNYEQRVARIVAEHASEGPTVGVAGHTHEALDTTRDGVRLLNPGTATAAPPGDRATMLAVAVDDGEYDVTLLEE